MGLATGDLGLVLIIVLGAPGVGKTTLARRMADELGLPLLVRDDVKEILFDTLGWSDREWSRKLGYASWLILRYMVGQFLGAGQSVIVESNFRADREGGSFEDLIARYHPRIVQVLCETAPDVAYERFKRRAESGERHPGHIDQVTIAAIEEQLRPGTWEPLPLEGEVIRVDLTDFEKVDYEGVVERISESTNQR